MRGVISDARVAGNDGTSFPPVACGRLNSARLFSRRVFDSLRAGELCSPALSPVWRSYVCSAAAVVVAAAATVVVAATAAPVAAPAAAAAAAQNDQDDDDPQAAAAAPATTVIAPHD